MQKFYYSVLFFFTLVSCKTLVEKLHHKSAMNKIFEENFDSEAKFISDWQDDSYKSPTSYFVKDGKLKITTRPLSKDRVKISTKRDDFGIGSYEWNIYIPKFTLHDQTSIGAFLYHSKQKEYEFDFEIGSGSKKDRAALKATLNQAVVYCTSQSQPFSSAKFLLSTEEWHVFKMELQKGEQNNYLVKWYVDGKLLKTLQTTVGVRKKFWVYNSLENLHFMGDQLPKKENYVFFESFYFKPEPKD